MSCHYQTRPKCTTLQSQSVLFCVNEVYAVHPTDYKPIIPPKIETPNGMAMANATYFRPLFSNFIFNFGLYFFAFLPIIKGA